MSHYFRSLAVVLRVRCFMCVLVRVFDAKNRNIISCAWFNMRPSWVISRTSWTTSRSDARFTQTALASFFVSVICMNGRLSGACTNCQLWRKRANESIKFVRIESFDTALSQSFCEGRRLRWISSLKNLSCKWTNTGTNSGIQACTTEEIFFVMQANAWFCFKAISIKRLRCLKSIVTALRRTGTAWMGKRPRKSWWSELPTPWRT